MPASPCPHGLTGSPARLTGRLSARPFRDAAKLVSGLQSAHLCWLADETELFDVWGQGIVPKLKKGEVVT